MYKRLVILALVAIVLAGCDLGREESPTPFPTVPPPAAEPGRSCSLGGIVASGEVVAVHEAQLGFTLPGRVQEVNVALGDEVVLMGSQGNETIDADEIGDWSGTISYEVLCALGNNNHRDFLI